jgi:hypothetical protein
MSKERLEQNGDMSRRDRGLERDKPLGSVDSMRGMINRKLMAVLAAIGLLGAAAGGGLWLYNEAPKVKEAVKEQISKELTELIKQNVDVFKVMLTFLEEYVKVFGESALDKVFNGDVAGLIDQLRQGIDGAKSVYDGLVTDVNELVTCYQDLQGAELSVLKNSLQKCTNPGKLIVGLGKLPDLSSHPDLFAKYEQLVNTNASLQRNIKEKLSDGYAEKLFWEHLFGSSTVAGNEAIVDTNTGWMNDQPNGSNVNAPVPVDLMPAKPSQVRIEQPSVNPAQVQEPVNPDDLEGYGAKNRR